MNTTALRTFRLSECTYNRSDHKAVADRYYFCGHGSVSVDRIDLEELAPYVSSLVLSVLQLERFVRLR